MASVTLGGGASRLPQGIALALCVTSVVGASGIARKAHAEDPQAVDSNSCGADAQPTAQSAAPVFELSLVAVGEYRAGQAGRAEVVLLAKDPYHVDKNYPLRFTVRPGPGVKYKKPVVRKDSAELSDTRATVPVAFIPKLEAPPSWEALCASACATSGIAWSSRASSN
jgi:hypothetical protein